MEVLTSSHVVLQMAGFGGSTGGGSSLKSEVSCPCGSGKEYGQCCEPVHSGRRKVTTDPIELVRARFSALAIGNVEFVLETTHPDHKEFVAVEQRGKRSQWSREILKFSQAYDFQTLTFDKPTEYDNDVAKVLFTAKLQKRSKKGTELLQELSTFQRSNQNDPSSEWLYLAGDVKSTLKDMDVKGPDLRRAVTTLKKGVPKGN